MRAKLSLNLDDLSIESFDTTTQPKAKGTVFGEQCTCDTNCTCPGFDTCDASCNGTCDGPCGTGYMTCFAWSCDACNTGGPCTTVQYTHCNGRECCPV